MGLAKAGQECFIELLNIYWGNVLNWAFVLGCPTCAKPFPLAVMVRRPNRQAKNDI